MKKGFFKVILVLIMIFSLGLNILLLHDKMNNTKDVEVESKDVKTKNTINYDKTKLGNMFRSYQTESELANADKLALFDVTKITYVGYFKSDTNKKLYYIEEKYSCMEGTDCLSAIDKVTIDKDGYSNTTFVVSVTPVDNDNAIFEILDYSIENTLDFQKAKHVILK